MAGENSPRGTAAASPPLSAAAASATSDVVAGEKRLNVLETRLKTAIATPAPASASEPHMRPTKPVSTSEAMGSIASPTSAGSPMASISEPMESGGGGGGDVAETKGGVMVDSRS